MKNHRSAKQEASMAKAAEAYNAEAQRIYEASREISELLAVELTNGEEKHWGHVGSLEHAADLLTRAANHLAGRDED